MESHASDEGRTSSHAPSHPYPPMSSRRSSIGESTVVASGSRGNSSIVRQGSNATNMSTDSRATITMTNRQGSTCSNIPRSHSKQPPPLPRHNNTSTYEDTYSPNYGTRIGGPFVDYLHDDSSSQHHSPHGAVQDRNHVPLHNHQSTRKSSYQFSSAVSLKSTCTGSYDCSIPGGSPDRLCTSSGEHPDWAVKDARPILPMISFFMGDMRDGLPMLNLQTTFLMMAKFYTAKQLGFLFLIFGCSSVIAMPISGYLLDDNNNKIRLVQWAAVATSGLTCFTAVFAQEYGENLHFIAIVKIFQGCAGTLLPLGLNSITLGIVGSTGMTTQIASNKMMSHLGTAVICAIGTTTVYLSYNHTNKLGFLFLVSPLWCMATLYYLWRIKPSHVDKDAARGLIIESPTMTEYEELDAERAAESDDVTGEGDEVFKELDATLSEVGSHPGRGGGGMDGYAPPQLPPMPEDKLNQTERPTLGRRESSSSASSATLTELTNQVLAKASVQNIIPMGKSFINTIGNAMPHNSCNGTYGREVKKPEVQTTCSVLMNPTFMTFTIIVLLFHLGNSAILPLVMQTLSVEDVRMGILHSGLCIIIAQAFMSVFAKISGDYSPTWGRKKLFLVGLFSLPLRCFLLFYFSRLLPEVEDQPNNLRIVRGLILSTQLLDAVGAGIFGTLYILVTNDIATETGRFNLMIGVNSSAMCLGGTVSGYVGQSLAQDYGYHAAFLFLGLISLLPAFMYLFCMPETLPDYVKLNQNAERRRFALLFFRLRRRMKERLARNKQQSPVPPASVNKTNGINGETNWVELV